MTKLSRRGFLFGTTALVAASSMPGPAVRVVAGPIGGAMSESEKRFVVTSLQRELLEQILEFRKAWRDIALYGEGGVCFTVGGRVRHVPLAEFKRHRVTADPPAGHASDAVAAASDGEGAGSSGMRQKPAGRL